jgi:hypothetical protein
LFKAIKLPIILVQRHRHAWTFEPDGTLRMFGGKCVTVAGRLGAAGVRVQLWPCRAGDREQQ